MYNNTRAYVQMSYAKNMSLYTRKCKENPMIFLRLFFGAYSKNIIRKIPANKDI